MSYTVHKFVWPVITMDSGNTASFEMPFTAKVIHVAEQNERYCLWVWLNSDEPKVTRKFSLCGTGHAAPPSHNTQHIGTIVSKDGNLVLHFFEEWNNE